MTSRSKPRRGRKPQHSHETVVGFKINVVNVTPVFGLFGRLFYKGPVAIKLEKTYADGCAVDAHTGVLLLVGGDTITVAGPNI